jgi:hypothetical protein
MVSFTLLPLNPTENEPPVSIGYEAVWAPEPVWTVCKDKGPIISVSDAGALWGPLKMSILYKKTFRTP